MSLSITFDPASGDFGTLDGDESKAVTFTLTMSEALGSAAVASIGSGTHFSVTGSVSVPALATSGSITVTFAGDSAEGTYTDTLTVKVQGQTVASLGLTAIVDTSSTVDVTTTYLLMEVPDYGSVTHVVPSVRASDAGSPTPVAAKTTLYESPTSYLRLGAFSYATEKEKAKELLAYMTQVTSATDPDNGITGDDVVLQDADADAGLSEVKLSGTVFADDIRTRAQDAGHTYAADPDHGMTQAQRAAESARLYARGGWRDHTDGNRITTTYGDKVEVIRGNYKMVVLGRADDASRAMGWDVGGGHIQDYSPGTMPGASYFLEWIDDDRYYRNGQQGVWLLANTTENVYEYARFAGNKREEIWGDVMETYIGSENPPEGNAAQATVTGTAGDGSSVTTGGAIADATTDANGDRYGTAGHDLTGITEVSGRNYHLPQSGDDDRDTPSWANDNNGVIRSNPHIIEKVWAKQVDSYLGTAACPVPKITETHYADEFNETVNVSGTFTTDFTADYFHETFTCGAEITESRVADKIKTTTGDEGDWTRTAVVEKFYGGISSMFYGHFFEFFLGFSESIKVGGFIDATLGPYEVNFDACPLLVDVGLAALMVDISRCAFKLDYDVVTGIKWETSMAPVDGKVGMISIEKQTLKFLG